MRATDVIRGVLDLIDQIETPVSTDVVNEPGEQTSRFKQILTLLANKDQPTQYSNTPVPVVSDVDSVTTLAGGGVNGSKHVDDIRVKDPSAYPNQQEY